MVRNILRFVLAVISISKSFEPSGEKSYLCGREQCQPEGFTVHVIFGVNFYDVK